MKGHILFFALFFFTILSQQVVFAGSGNQNTAPSVSLKLVSSDSTMGMGTCSNGLYIIGQSFDKANPRFPFRILVRITYIAADGELTYSALQKDGSTLEELYDQINYDSGFANFTIDLGNCSSKPQTVSITSIYKAPNDGIELFTSSAPLATIPTVPTE